MVKVIKEDTAVSFRVFLAVIGLLVTLMTVSTGYFFDRASKVEARFEEERKIRESSIGEAKKDFHTHIDEVTLNNKDIEVKLTAIQSDILWIRRALDGNEPNHPVSPSKVRGRIFDK